jgi:hypothetical protein
MKYINWDDYQVPQTIMPSSFHYAGKFDPNRTYSYGDIVEYNGNLHVYQNNNHYTIITSATIEYPENKCVEIVTQCRNCGAPTYENGRCPYCGTINRKVQKFNAR